MGMKSANQSCHTTPASAPRSPTRMHSTLRQPPAALTREMLRHRFASAASGAPNKSIILTFLRTCKQALRPPEHQDISRVR